MIKDDDVMLIDALNITSKLDKPLILSRRGQQNIICEKINRIREQQKSSNFKCIFLTGMSGSGKSILLSSFLKPHLEENGEKVLYIKENYNTPRYIQTMIEENRSSVVIFDQFEDALEFSDFDDALKEWSGNISFSEIKPIVYIFSFPKDYYYDVRKKFNTLFADKNYEYMACDTHFITSDKCDIDEIKLLIANFAKVNGTTVTKCLELCEKELAKNSKPDFKNIFDGFNRSIILLCSVLARVKMGISPLVEFSVVSYIYEIYSHEIEKDLEKYVCQVDEVFYLYLNHWTSRYPHEETGKMIIYLLCDRKIHTEEDIKFITFEKEKYFENTGSFNIINSLKHNAFVSVKERNRGFRTTLFAKHDYLGLKMKDYCFKNLSNSLRQNIDHYCNEISEKDCGRIRDRYTRFNNLKSRYVLDVLLIIMLVIVLAVSLSVHITEENYIYMKNGPIVTLGTLLATYYFYNSIIQSTIILEPVYYAAEFFMGIALVPVCYLFPQQYGIYMGIILISYGLTQYNLKSKTKYGASQMLAKTGIVYSVFGFLVMVFGIDYMFNPNISTIYFFIIYVMGALYGHTKYSYVIERIGHINTI